MLYKYFKLVSGLVTDLEYDANDNIEFLSKEQHDTIYQLIHTEAETEFNFDAWTLELVELMRMLVLTPSVEEICTKWLKFTGNKTLWMICKKLNISVDFNNNCFKTSNVETIEKKGLLFKMKQLQVFCDINKLALNGHLECLKYAHKNGSTFNVFTISNAALNGHLDCLKYLHEQGCPWDKSATSNAALNGHLDCLKYLHQQGCPWDKRATSNAAFNGHLDCLKYLHQQGCPWDKTVTSREIARGHLDCLKYLYENGCLIDGGNVDCFYYLRLGL